MPTRPSHVVASSLGLAVILASAGPSTAASLDEAVASFQARKYEEARAILEPLAKAEPRNARVAGYLGRTYLELEAWDAAIEVLETAVALDPLSSEWNHRLGQALGSKARTVNMLRQATLAPSIKRQFERATELDTRNFAAFHDLIQFYLEAPSLLGGSSAEALRLAKHVQQYDRQRGFAELARVYEHTEDFGQADETYRAAIAEFPALPGFRTSLGYLQQRQQRWEAAFETFEALAALPGQEGIGKYQIGRTSALSGLRLERGLECLSEYTRQPPATGLPPLSAAYFRLGQLQLLAGQKALARQSFAETLRLDPKHEEARKVLKSL
jgi:tetratricopeptide (TPR) repeat protein